MTEPTPLPADIHAYYEELGEVDRLTGTAVGQLEFMRTKDLLLRLLPEPPADVLDVGGATGVYAAWLSNEGYTVRLIDPIPAQVGVARTHGGFAAEVGDARRLAVADNSTDAVLMLGPLYHLPKLADRRQALAEAYRVLRSSGFVAAAAINRYAILLGLGAEGRLDDSLLSMLPDVLRTGNHNTKIGFATAYYHKPDELLGEIETAGFVASTVVSIEGPLWTAAIPRGENVDVGFLTNASSVALAAEPYPDLTACGAHLLAVGRKPS